MGQYEQKDLEGSLFKNKHKKEDKHPLYKGNCKINGVLYEIGAWLRTPKSGGETFMSLSFQEKRDQPPQDRQVDRGQQRQQPPEEDNPF